MSPDWRTAISPRISKSSSMRPASSRSNARGAWRRSERRGAHLRDGHGSVVSWLAGRIGIPWWVATRHVRLARALPRMPRTSAALADGTISIPGAEQLVFARNADSGAFDRCESMLVDLARRLSARDLRRAIEQWRSLADAVADEAEAVRRFERRDQVARRRMVTDERGRSSKRRAATGGRARRGLPLSNLVPLCRSHHRAVHEGKAARAGEWCPTRPSTRSPRTRASSGSRRTGVRWSASTP
jgi:hypothetical protein